MRRGTVQTRRHAFSLVEMLVVISLMALLVGLVTPALLGLVDNTNLKVATGSLNDLFSLARQTAVTSNRAVEVRIYKIPKENAPANAAESDRYYRAAAVYRMDDMGPRRISELVLLKGNVRCADDPKFGTLLHDTPSAQEELGELGGGTQYTYRYVQFRADGTTTLPTDTSDTWHVMLHNGNRTPEKAFEANYTTIQVDPGTGRTRVYFPGN